MFYILKKKTENRNSAGIPEGNRKTIKAARGCSERAGGQNPVPDSALHPGAPDRSRIEKPASREEGPGREQRAAKEADVGKEDGGERDRQVRSRGSSAQRFRDAGLGRHGPCSVPGSRVPSRPPLTPQSSPRSEIVKSNHCGTVLAYPQTPSLPLTDAAMARGEAAAPDSKNPVSLSKSHADWRALSTSS